jgi:hypothetical protein
MSLLIWCQSVGEPHISKFHNLFGSKDSINTNVICTQILQYFICTKHFFLFHHRKIENSEKHI